MGSYNLQNVLRSKEFGEIVDSLHRDYYESWRRTADPRERDLLAAKADALDDVVASMIMMAGDSDAPSEN